MATGYLQFKQSTLQGGVNFYGPASKIADHYATELTNIDARTPGQLVKRKEPTHIATCGGSGTINGMHGFVDSTGVRWIVMARGGKVYKWDGTATAPTEYTVSGPGGTGTVTLSTSNPVRGSMALNKLYMVDGENGLVRFNGTTAGCVSATALYIPIVPGTVSISDESSITITDDGVGGLVWSGHPTWSGTIDYATGAYTFSSNPFTTGDTVTATFKYGTEQSPVTFGHAASDGTFQYYSLLHAPIVASSLTLTDGTVTLSTNDTSAGVDYPTGWKQIIITGGSYGAGMVVGAYDPVTAKLMVDVGVFAASTAITASYSTPTGDGYDTGIVSELYEDGLIDHEYTPADGVAHYPVSIVDTGSADDAGVYFTNFYAHFNCSVKTNGTIYQTGEPSLELGTFNFTTGQWNAIGSNAGTPSDSWTGTVTYKYNVQVTDEAVGTSDADGKLYRYVIDDTDVCADVTLTDGTNTAVAGNSGNFVKSGVTVGTFNFTTFLIEITTADTFTDYATLTLTYSKESADTEVEVSNGPLSGIIGSSIPSGATDICWQAQRMCLASKKNLFYSDALTPETFSQLPKGTGVNIKRIMDYSSDQLFMFCGPDSKGDSIYSLDMSGTTPLNWPTTKICGIPSLKSEQIILRAATNTKSDFFYTTKDGLRSLNLTTQDAISGPTLPLDLHVSPWLSEINEAVGDVRFAEVFNDEFIRFEATGTDTLPATAFCYSLTNAYVQTVATGLPHDGWSRIEFDVSLVAALAWDFGNGTNLYACGSDGKIYQLLSASTTTTTGTVISKAYEAENSMQDIIPQWLYVKTSNIAAGTYTVSLIDDQDREYSLGSHTIAATAPTLNTHAFECRDSAGVLPSGKAWRVKITTTAYVIIDSWQLICMPEKARQTEQDDDESGTAITTASMLSTAITPAAF